MASGVKVNKECIDKYEELKMGSKSSKPKPRFLVFKLNDKQTEIEVDTEFEDRWDSDPNATQLSEHKALYEEFKEGLLSCTKNGKKECRYAVYDLHFEFNGNLKNKIIFIAWNPEVAAIKSKMIYTSSKDYLKKALKVVIEAQCTDADELSYEEVAEKCKRGMKD